MVSSFIGSLTTHGRATNGIFSTNNHPRHHPPHQRPHKLAEPLVPQHPLSTMSASIPYQNAYCPYSVPHERVDRRDEVACGDGARLAGSGVEQGEEGAAHEPGKFVTEELRRYSPHPLLPCRPLQSCGPRWRSDDGRGGVTRAQGKCARRCVRPTWKNWRGRLRRLRREIGC